MVELEESRVGLMNEFFSMPARIPLQSNGRLPLNRCHNVRIKILIPIQINYVDYFAFLP